MSFKVPEIHRIIKGPLASSSKDGNNGFFSYGVLRIIASDEGVNGSAPWEHVSVSRPDRCPSWSEMCMVKNMFWGPEDCVAQFHPPQSQYVNNHEYCLHLWRKVGSEFELPPTEMVGIK